MSIFGISIGANEEKDWALFPTTWILPGEGQTFHWQKLDHVCGNAEKNLIYISLH